MRLAFSVVRSPCITSSVTFGALIKEIINVFIALKR